MHFHKPTANGLISQHEIMFCTSAVNIREGNFRTQLTMVNILCYSKYKFVHVYLEL